MPNTIYVLNGPNLNLLGTREPEIYGRATLADVEKLCRDDGGAARPHGRVSPVQPRRRDHRLDPGGAREKAAGLIINPAGYSHTSVAILDALLALTAPVIEVHISNIHAREQFRRRSYVSQAARAVICGFGIDGYALAIDGLAAHDRRQSRAV